MYGLVNRAVKEFAIQQMGEAAWQEICRLANVKDGYFVAMEAYDDDLTYALVQAASEYSGLSADQVLEGFGEYWVLFTGNSAYGGLMAAAGTNLRDFLGNLDSLHSEVGRSLPRLAPPSFLCEEETETSILVTYLSRRPGLGAMVVGLLRGLGKRFGEEISVEWISHKASEEEGDRFRVTFHA